MSCQSTHYHSNVRLTTEEKKTAPILAINYVPPMKQIVSQFQQTRVARFCELFNMPTTLPTDKERLKELFWHLLYDDSKRMVFCYVPKVKKSTSRFTERESVVACVRVHNNMY